jgi:iron(III) transport system ATP-binding protein
MSAQNQSAHGAVLSLKDIRQAYGSHQVVRGLSFELERGAIGCLLGPSGCGKTTVLRCIAGFEPIQSGEIRLNASLVSSPGVMVPPEQRSIGMVFQDYALFPHLTVAQNIAFGLFGIEKRERDWRVAHYLEATGLTGLDEKYPHQLSGGQQQRVALARAIAPRPDLILLDEPFSNLDVALRERLAADVRNVIKPQHDRDPRYPRPARGLAIADEVGVIPGESSNGTAPTTSIIGRPRASSRILSVRGYFCPVQRCHRGRSASNSAC